MVRFARFLTFSFVFCILCSIIIIPVLKAEGTYSNIGTTDGADGSNDAINFSQGRVWTVDQYGKYIWLTQTRVSTTTHWAWSNDKGSTWTQGAESYTFLTRGSVAYDSINDKLHVLWTATDSNDGIIYRRYGITRDGSNNITAISREDSGNINLQLDTSSSRTLEQAVAYWVNDGSANGILVAGWTKHGSSLSEARVSMRKLTLTAADGVAANWIAPDGAEDTFATDPPAVDADKVYSDNGGSSALSLARRGGTGAHKDDLYVFVAEEEDSNTDTVLSYRATWDSVDGDWSGGWTSLGSMGAMDTSSGYSLKYQLITKPVIDTTNDRLYVGWARWKDGTNGDTVSISYLNSTDNISSTIDIYSALATHPYAPTLDIAYDATMDQLYVSYIQATTNGDNGSIDYKTYNGTTLSSATRFYTSPGGSAGANGSADIPILYESRYDGKLLFAFRVNGALPPTGVDPHEINWGYITLPTPTPTPTPTATAQPTVQTTTPSGPQCNDVVPTNAPYMSQPIVNGANSIDIVFSSWNPFYTVEYGYDTKTFPFAVSGIKGGTFTINSLLPHTKYYFRVAIKNGCTIGPWSNIVSAQTTGGSSIPGISITTPRPTARPFGVDPIINITKDTDTTLEKSPSPTPIATSAAEDKVQEEVAPVQSNYLKMVGVIMAGVVLVVILTGAYRKLVV